MKRHAILAVAIVLLTIGSVWAADISGKWAGKIPGGPGAGESEVTLVFKVEGDTVTGTLNNSVQPGEVQIQEGKIGGDDISFSVMRNIGGTDMKVLWKGTISGDEIKFTRTAAAGGAPTEITARRTK
jgi:hypothetical protein